MNLPNYFLADLPAEATLTPVMISEACQALKRNRERYLVGRSTQSLVKVLSEVAEGWLDPEYPFRKLALEQGAHAASFSQNPATVNSDRAFCAYLALRPTPHPNPLPCVQGRGGKTR